VSGIGRGRRRRILIVLAILPPTFLLGLEGTLSLARSLDATRSSPPTLPTLHRDVPAGPGWRLLVGAPALLSSAPDASFPLLVEEAEHRARVGAISGPFAGLGRLTAALCAEVERQSPVDTVVLCASSRACRGLGPVWSAAEPPARLALVRLVEALLSGSSATESWRAELVRLQEVCRESGARLVIAWLPELAELRQGTRRSAEVAGLESTALGLPLLDLTPAFEGVPPDELESYFLAPADVYGDAALARIAAELAAALDREPGLAKPESAQR
jgi:hypothetical protein